MKKVHLSFWLGIVLQGIVFVSCSSDPASEDQDPLGDISSSSFFTPVLESSSSLSEGFFSSAQEPTETSSSAYSSPADIESSSAASLSSANFSSSSCYSSSESSSSSIHSSSSIIYSSSEIYSSSAYSSSVVGLSSASSSSSKPWINPNPKLIGADISKFQEYESRGVKIFDTNGSEKDIFEILREHGFNAIRLKTFVSPKTQYGYSADGCGSQTNGQDREAFGDKAHVIAYAKRVKQAGFYFLLDFHYSDNWADPGKQIIPERWRHITNSNEMADSVYAYTYDMLQSLGEVNAIPDMVQVGNEITNGLLRDLPTNSTDCWGNGIKTANASVSGIMSTNEGKANTAKYLKAGCKAVKDFSNKIKTAFHIENVEKTNTVSWWMTEIFKTQQVSADVMAFSAYTAYDDGHPNDWQQLILNLSRTYPNLEFLIAEYNGGGSASSYDFDGSRYNTHAILDDIPYALGAFFWEPGESGAWGAALFDWKGNELHANAKAFEEYDKLKKEPARHK